MNYFLTFRTYGTRLHGDERGSVDRRHNQYGEPLLASSELRKRKAENALAFPPLTLDEEHRLNIEQTINEVAVFRNWHLHAIAVKSNHVHIVVSVPEDITPERVMNDFRARATLRLREEGLIDVSRKVWERHGSTKYLINEKEMSKACDYILNRQNETKE
jgi:REP element-mobilizing transposase RayT